MATPLPKLAAPARRALAAEGIKSVEDVASRSREAIERLHGMGPRAMESLEESLKKAGMEFKTPKL